MSIRVTIACATAVLCAVLPAGAQTASQGAAQTAAETAASAQTPPVKRESVSRLITGFNIVLVVGEAKPSGSASADELPAGARKALTDMREFLPFKHYRVLDAQWTSCCLPTSQTAISGRLQGVVGVPSPNGAVNLVNRGYSFRIMVGRSIDNLPVQFVLAVDEGSRGHAAQGGDVDGRERERLAQDLQAEIETLRAQINNMQQRVEIGTASPLEVRPMQDRMASMQRRLVDLRADSGQHTQSDGRAIIDSSFTMAAGETVVVGTSKLGGDKALIAILTAVRR